MDNSAYEATASRLDEIATAMLESAGKQKDDEAKQSQASAVVEYVEGAFDLFHDQNKDVFAQDRMTHEVCRIDSRQFRDRISASFYQETGKALRDQSIREAIGTCAGLGRYRGELRDVALRVAGKDGRYFLDLAEPGNSGAIIIEPGRWSIIERPPVMFFRTEAMQPIPRPVGHGDIGDMWQIANIPEPSRILFMAWMMESLRPDTPYPALELIGEQGSAKSTTQAAAKRMMDPNACDLRTAPKSVEDVFVGAGVNHVVSYENVSHLTNVMQDAFCVLATGGGFATRTLYTNHEETVISVKRPVAINGISATVTTQDMVDRTVSIELPVITHRQEINDLWRDFEAARPRILGALLDIFVRALALLPDIHLPPEDRPRLAEFARLGMAVAVAVGHKPDDFLEQFKASRMESIGRTIDASPVASALLEWFARNPNGRSDSVKAIFTEVERFKPTGTDSWPRSAKGFADALRRAAPALRQMGIECKSLGKGSGGVVRWCIEPKRTSRSGCPESPKSQMHDVDGSGLGTSGTSGPWISSDAEVF
jgi:hypothetical protein